MEQSKILHLVIAALSGYLFLIFAWWWIKNKAATTIYGATCFLMLGIFSTHIGAWWVYYQSCMGELVLDDLTKWY